MKALNDFGQFIVDNYKSQLEAEHIANGELYRTLSYAVSSKTSSWVVSISLADYWKYIENGRRAGAKYPPLDAIEKWINARQIIPHQMTLKSGKTVIPSIKQLSFLIARSISQKGIKPRPLFKKSFDAVKQEFLIKIEEAIVQDIKEGLEF
jgi:hypothetical protein